MTVAPELPPASADRRQADNGAVPLARAGRRRLPAHPAGAVVVRPARTAPARPGRRAPAERHVAAPGVTDWWPDPAAEPVTAPVERGARPVEPVPRPGAGAAGEHHPAVPGRLRTTGVRVVRPARPPLRLTRRGIVLLVLFAGLATLMAMLAITARVESLREPVAPVPASAPAEVVVAPGETLWSIAERVAPDRDPRVVVDQLRRINGLPSGDVEAGQRLVLRTR